MNSLRTKREDTSLETQAVRAGLRVVRTFAIAGLDRAVRQRMTARLENIELGAAQTDGWHALQHTIDGGLQSAMFAAMNFRTAAQEDRLIRVGDSDAPGRLAYADCLRAKANNGLTEARLALAFAREMQSELGGKST